MLVQCDLFVYEFPLPSSIFFFFVKNHYYLDVEFWETNDNQNSLLK